MLRKLIFAVLVAMMLVLAGCGGGSGDGDTTGDDGGGGGGGDTTTELSEEQEEVVGESFNAVSEAATLAGESMYIPGGAGGAALGVMPRAEINESISIDLDQNGVNDVTITYTGTSQTELNPTTFTFDLTGDATFISDFSYSEGDSTYTIYNGSSYANTLDVVMAEGNGDLYDLTIDLSASYSDFSVDYTDGLSSGSIVLNGSTDMTFAGTIDPQAEDGEGMDGTAQATVDLTAVITEDGETYTVGFSGNGSVNIETGDVDVVYYVSIDGTTYGPYTESELEAF
ncbi:DUF7537 family lipoprotein [Limisalsivibrio acetivorans]|uniref:DUF7537 family lipoprotein n=1 Tax=Limisalsivibrio acetivorans TaxID=1304888 RepID=UPI0003B42318|nr:hypothetical protein [Limisalsivibrio acetivorans]